MDKELRMIICMFASLITMVIGFGNLSRADIHTYKITLTKEGCFYAESVGLLPEKKGGLCSITTRFWPDRIGEGGVIILDNDQHMSISSSMLLATQKSVADLPPTSDMKSTERWAWFWISLTALLFGTALLLGRGNGKP